MDIDLTQEEASWLIDALAGYEYTDPDMREFYEKFCDNLEQAMLARATLHIAIR